jgi:uncharacterized protein YerC
MRKTLYINRKGNANPKANQKLDFIISSFVNLRDSMTHLVEMEDFVAPNSIRKLVHQQLKQNEILKHCLIHALSQQSKEKVAHIARYIYDKEEEYPLFLLFLQSKEADPFTNTNGINNLILLVRMNA